MAFKILYFMKLVGKLALLAFLLSAVQISWANQFDINEITYSVRYYRTSIFSVITNAWLLTTLCVFTGNLRIALLLASAVISILGFLDLQKQIYLSAHLQPQDVFMLKDLLTVLPSLLKALNWTDLLIAPISALAFVFLIIAMRSRLDILLKPFLWVFIFLFPLIIYVCYLFKLEESWVKNNRTGALVFIPNFNHWQGDAALIKSYGVVPYLFANVLKSSVPHVPPDGYSPSVTTFLADFKKQELSVDQLAKAPDIIVIMSEAFWLVGREFAIHNNGESYHPTIDQLKPRALLVPGYGGGTANTEFEVLTGISKYFYPEYSPYVSLVKEPVASALPALLKGYGYRTVAFHPFDGNNYRRHIVYPALGFDQFIAIDDMNELYPELVNNYSGDGYKNRDFIADTSVNIVVLDQLSQADQPLFLFAVTMQNHGVYRDDRFKDKTLNVSTNKVLTAESKQSLNTYVTGVSASDRALAELLNELSERDRPTLVVFFGDHLPNMKAVYDELGYSDKFLSAIESKYTTPLVVWHNKNDLPLLTDDVTQPFSSVFLAPKILTWAGLALPPYYQFLSEVERRVPMLHYDLTKDRKYAPFIGVNQKILKQLYLLNYDLLQGDGFIDTSFK